VVKRKRSNGKFKPLSIDETCAILHCHRRHFQRIKHNFHIKRMGRRLLINEYSVHRYIRSLPDVNR
jgi:hypothetical protein